MNRKKGLYEKYFKRLVDIILSGFALIILSPVMIVVAIMVKMKLGSPVIFKQNRPGKDEQIFFMYKFRTMVDKRDENGELLTDSLRLTPFGKWLRATSLDELPELWNILKGDMSIVGPRPLLVRYLPYYSNEQKKRHLVRPGLTGLAQIRGRNNVNWYDRFALDVQYVENVSLGMDFQILFQTVKKTLKKEDVVVVGTTELLDFDEEFKRKRGMTDVPEER